LQPVAHALALFGVQQALLRRQHVVGVLGPFLALQQAQLGLVQARATSAPSPARERASPISAPTRAP
jgi:hypothetical protein